MCTTAMNSRTAGRVCSTFEYECERAVQMLYAMPDDCTVFSEGRYNWARSQIIASSQNWQRCRAGCIHSAVDARQWNGRRHSPAPAHTDALRSEWISSAIDVNWIHHSSECGVSIRMIQNLELTLIRRWSALKMSLMGNCGLGEFSGNYRNVPLGADGEQAIYQKNR